MRNNNIFEFFVDLDHLEFHGLANEHIVVADGLNVNLRTGEEGFDAEYIDNHAAFGTALDKAFDNFIVSEGGIDAFPAAGSTSLTVRQDELALLVFLVFDEHFNYVANLDVGVVAEFVHGDDTVRLVADVNHSLTLVEGDDGTFDYVFVLNGVERLVVSFGEFLTGFFTSGFAVFVGVPVEIFDGRVFEFSHLKS